MQESILLSTLLLQIQETIDADFGGTAFWIKCRTMNVKKYEVNKRCYLTLEEVVNGVKRAEAKAVFWSNSYFEIEKFEQLTKQPFANGTEIICKVRVRFHQVYGFNLDVLEISAAATLGAWDIERQQILTNLIENNKQSIQLIDDVYYTKNNRLPIPLTIKKIALITAPNSDGLQDFMRELIDNKHQYTFEIDQYLTTIQGDTAHLEILKQLTLIKESKTPYEVVVITRGGGAIGDFKPFEKYELAETVANFDIPIFTGIGHDRNQSIVDMMATSFKTPTKVAAQIVEYNANFEASLLRIYDRLHQAITNVISDTKEALSYTKRVLKLADPSNILKRGFAIVLHEKEIITEAGLLQPNDNITIQFYQKTVVATVNTINENGK